MVGWEFPPKFTGGLGIHLGGLVNSLKSKVNLSLFIPEDNGPGVIDGVRVFNVSSSKELFFDRIMDINKRIVNSLNNIALDIFHCHDWISFPSGVKAKEEYGVPLICSIHSTEHDRAGTVLSRNNPIVRIERDGLNAADKIITVSNYMKEQLVDLYGIENSKIAVIHNGLTKDRVRITKGDNIAFIGRFTEQKGIEYLLYSLKDVNFNGKIILAGEGYLADSLKKFAEILGIGDKIEFTGFIMDAVLDLKARIVVVPSLREPFGIVALETLASGIPLVISRTAGVSELLSHNKNALLINPHNHEELKEAVSSLLSDGLLHSKLKLNGLKLVKSSIFDWDKLADKTVAVYKSVNNSFS